MEDNFYNQQNDSIPEGLEFNESYMNQAFEMYDAAKKSRKRRLFIWFWRSSLGFAAIVGISVGIYFATRADAPTTQQTPKAATQSSHRQSVESAKSTNGNVILEQGQTNAQQQPLTASATSPESNRVSNNNNNNNNRNGGSQHGTAGTFSGKPGSEKVEPVTAGRFLTALLHGSKTPLANASATANRLMAQTGTPAAPDSVNVNQTPKNPTIADSTTATTAPVAIDSASLRYPFVNTSNHHIYLNMGVNTLFGISELKNSFNMRESFGLGYDYSFGKRYVFSLNAEYHTISKINYYRYIGENEKSLTSSTYFTKTTLKFLTIAPKIGVTFGKRHTATVGAGFEYLMNGNDPKYLVRDYANETPADGSDYYSTFNRFNFYAGVGYGLRISKSTSLFATYHYGFSDVIKNTPENDAFDRNSRLQLMLRVKLY